MIFGGYNMQTMTVKT